MLDSHSRIILPSYLAAVTVALAAPAVAGQDQRQPSDGVQPVAALGLPTDIRSAVARRVASPPLLDGDVLGDPA